GKQNAFTNCKDGDRRNDLQSQNPCSRSRSLKILISNRVASIFHQNSSLSTSPNEVISTTIVNKAGPSHPRIRNSSTSMKKHRKTAVLKLIKNLVLDTVIFRGPKKNCRSRSVKAGLPLAVR